MANASRSGLAGYLYSRDVAQMARVSRRMQVGMVGVNETMISCAEAAFGGVKESGLGEKAAPARHRRVLSMEVYLLWLLIDSDITIVTLPLHNVHPVLRMCSCQYTSVYVYVEEQPNGPLLSMSDLLSANQ